MQEIRISAQNWIAHITDELERRGHTSQLLLIVAAIVVGAVTALGAIIFIWLLGQINDLAQAVTDRYGPISMLAFMTVAGVIVGFLIDRFAAEAKGHGVPEVMEAIALRGGRIRPQVAAVKVMASAITIGSGGSAGREGPIVQVGSAFGSTLGQALNFSEEHLRTLVACGAAAGIAATFNAPIAGALFALEVILGRLTVRHFGAIVISAVSASVVSRAVLGNEPAFTVPAFGVNHLAEIPIYAVLGVLSALVAVLFIKMLYTTEGMFDRWGVPLPLKTALGMLLTGLVVLAVPGGFVAGPGLHLMGDIIAVDFDLTLGLMTALLFGKLLATTFTLGSGNSGGVFAPSLFMGAVLGGIVGTLGKMLWPEVVINPGAYAIVGMSALFAGAARAPITSIIIVFEMSNDYKLILPLMLATVISTLLAEIMQPDSIYTLKLRLKGINWGGGRDQDVLQGVLVGEVARRTSLETVRKDALLKEIEEALAHSHYNTLPVLDEMGKLWGVVSVSDVERALSEPLPEPVTVTDIGTGWPHLRVTYPDETIGVALSRLGSRGLGRMPVVSREDPYELVGMIGRQDIIRAYDLALTKRDEIQHRAERMLQLQKEDGTEFVDIYLAESDQAVGMDIKTVAQQLPRECVLVSIERNGRVIIPHGNTVLRAGDHLVAFTRAEDAQALFTILHHEDALPPENL
jgi:chloride channel protein, CIC family